jgi:8-oxo-dGTP pyrophosphatase MutT (NUDIX family)
VLNPADLGFRSAAVLIPFLVRDDGTRLLFTLRSPHLRGHAGQISFPGGACDATDLDHVATAIREAEEEVGIDPSSVRPIGLLDDIPTPTGYVITPVVAELVPPPDRYAPNEAEVAEVFELGFSALRDPTVFQDRGEVERWGRKFRLVAFTPAGREIWGATARMVQFLIDLVR